jgi:hypothetical protein
MSTYHRRGGHYPGHYRDAFLEAIDAFSAWEANEPEPTIEFETNFVPRDVKLSEACRLLWNCSDILPTHAFTTIEDCGIRPGRRTYAAAARAIYATLI